MAFFTRFLFGLPSENRFPNFENHYILLKNKYFWLSGAFNIRSFLDANLVHFRFKSPKIESWGRLGALLEVSWGLLERLEGLLGAS